MNDMPSLDQIMDAPDPPSAPILAAVLFTAAGGPELRPLKGCTAEYVRTAITKVKGVENDSFHKLAFVVRVIFPVSRESAPQTGSPLPGSSARELASNPLRICSFLARRNSLKTSAR